MGKHMTKPRAALDNRQRDWDNIKNKELLQQYGQMAHRPGSQNRKKGYGKGSRRR